MRKSKSLVPAVGICLVLLLVLSSFLTACATPAATPSPTQAPAPKTEATAAPKATTPAPKTEASPAAKAEPAAAPKGQPVELKLVTFLPANAPRAQIVLKLVERINERLKGELSIKHVGGPEVVPGTELGQAVQRGTVDIGFLPSAFYEGLVPVGNILLLSQVSAKEERDRGAWDALKELHAKAGLQFLWRIDPSLEPQFYLAFRNEVKTLADLKGIKVGAVGNHAKAFSEALGMGMVSVPTTEAYTAVERGVVDAFSTAADTHISYGDYEKLKYILDHPYYTDNTVWIMNMNKWNSLSKDLQSKLWNVYLEFEPELAKMHKDMIAASNKKMAESGAKFIKLSADEGKKFLDTVYSAEWARLTEAQPEAVKALKDKISK